MPDTITRYIYGIHAISNIINSGNLLGIEGFRAIKGSQEKWLGNVLYFSPYSKLKGHICLPSPEGSLSISKALSMFKKVRILIKLKDFLLNAHI